MAHKVSGFTAEASWVILTLGSRRATGNLELQTWNFDFFFNAQLMNVNQNKLFYVSIIFCRKTVAVLK